MAFTKYEQQGAYHWTATYQQSRWRRSLRLHARYDIPLKLLRKRLDLRFSDGLDVGCGDGVLLYKVKKEGGNIKGLDLEEEGLRLAEQELSKRGVKADQLLQASCYQIPLVENSVDYITSIEVFEHLDDVNAFLRESLRVLRPGGWMVLTTPNRGEDQAFIEVRDPFHVHEYAPEELANLLQQFFTDIEICGAYPGWLDRLYKKATGIVLFDRAVRLVLKSFGNFLANPYLFTLKKDPDHRWELLVAVARKKL